MELDPLTSILQSIRLSGSVLSRAEGTAPWAVHSRGDDAGIFHAVLRGRCCVVAKEKVVPISAGQVVVLPHGCSHVMADDPGTPPVPIADLFEPVEPGEVPTVRCGGGGARASIICGRIEFEKGDTHPLLTVLPDVIHQMLDPPSAGPGLKPLIEMLDSELDNQRPGNAGIVSRLAEVLVIHLLRMYITNLSQGRGGWLCGLTDPHIAKALGLIHTEPSMPWTAQNLASSVGMSRTAFFNRFGELVGTTPRKYLTRWRMHLAAKALKGDNLSVVEAAELVGYDSETSFSRIFKSYLGVPPAAYRRSSVTI